MRTPSRWRRLKAPVICVCLLVLNFGTKAACADLRVAVASNFAQTLAEICRDYFGQRKDRCIVTSGASGLLYAQIHQGAPFDIFLSADVARPAQLEAIGLTVPASRFTYATGQLVYWQPGVNTGPSLREALNSDEIRVLALANPDTAPYGMAAIATLRALGISANRFRLVVGENIAQAFQFVATGAADAGFVARAQILRRVPPEGRSIQSGVWLVDERLHRPIEQQAVLLKSTDNRLEAESFLAYLRSPAAATIIRQAGYAVPDH